MPAPLPEIPWSAIRPSDSTAEMPSILDLTMLRNRCLGNEQLVLQILRKLESAFVEGLEAVDKAWEEGDLPTVATAAHRLKGTAANVAAERLRRVADGLEAAAIARQSDEVERQTVQLRVELRQLSDAIQQHLTSLSIGLNSK